MFGSILKNTILSTDRRRRKSQKSSNSGPKKGVEKIDPKVAKFDPILERLENVKRGFAIFSPIKRDFPKIEETLY